MAKAKFELTADIVKVEPEPEFERKIPIIPSTNSLNKEEERGAVVFSTKEVEEAPTYLVDTNRMEKETLGLKIDKILKKEFQIWCIRNSITMTDALEAAIKSYLK